MKKLLGTIAAVAGAAVLGISAAGCAEENLFNPDGANGTIQVATNAFFAPFEYFEGTKIQGVDVDIMTLVGKKLDKKVKFTNMDFDAIIPNVEKGTQYDCGAAGITIKPERAEKVDFSIPYYASVQYVVFKNASFETHTVSSNDTEVTCVYWDSLKDKNIGVQLDTTGDLFVLDEMDGGALDGMSDDKLVEYPDALTAVADLDLEIEVVVLDELPAKYIVKNNSSLKCYPLYYSNGDVTEEEYAICVTKGNSELLNAINAVLNELGSDGINALVSKHFGLGD